MAARRDKEHVEMVDFEDAKDKVMMGAERKTMIISDEEKRTTAYHEGGHALVAKLLPGSDPHPQGDDHSTGPCLGPDPAAPHG